MEHMNFGRTAVAHPYALQTWSDQNTGGEALLEQASSTGWSLVSYGGGAWDVLGLMEQGVPRANAELLVTALNNGALVARASRPIEVPAGNTVMVGTPSGRVETTNSYRSAAYLAADQHAIVIRQSPEYDIVYDVPDNHFLIYIFSKPLKDARRAAEDAILEALNISEQDACKLTVHEFVTGLASRIYNVGPMSLSFCTAP